MYKPHLFAEILSKKSKGRLIHETIALKGSKQADLMFDILLDSYPVSKRKKKLLYTHKVNISTKIDLTFFDKFNVKGVNSKEMAKLENCFQSDLCYCCNVSEMYTLNISH